MMKNINDYSANDLINNLPDREVGDEQLFKAPEPWFTPSTEKPKKNVTNYEAGQSASQMLEDNLKMWQESMYPTQFDAQQKMVRNPSMTNHLGDKLPEMAYGWDMNGNPYYGEGFDRIKRQFQSRMLGTTRDGKKEPYLKDDGWWKKTTGWIKDREGVVGATLRGVGATTGAFFDAADVAAKWVGKQWYQSMQAGEILGEGSNLFTNYKATPEWETVEEFADRIGPDAIFGEYDTDNAWNGRMWTIANFVDNMIDTVGTTLDPRRNIRVWSNLFNPNVDFIERWKDAHDTDAVDRQAGRVMYSAWAHGDVLSEEYTRRVADGEDPGLVALDMEDPIAQMAGEIIFDPLAVLGFAGKYLKGEKAIKTAKGLMTASDEIVDAVRGLDKITDANGFVKWSDELADTVQTVMKSNAKNGIKWEQFRDRISLFELTADGKKAYMGYIVQDLGNFILANSEDADEVAEAFKAMYMMASPLKDEVAEGLEIARHWTAPGSLLSEAGQTTGYFLREIIGKTPDKFLREIQDIASLSDDTKRVAAFAEYWDTKTVNGLEKWIPSILERVNKGEKLNKGVVYAAKIEARMHKIYKPFNTFFAGVYMGLSPGYAFRNMLTNSFHVGTDAGWKALVRGGVRQWGSVQPHQEHIMKMVGFLPKSLVGLKDETTRSVKGIVAYKVAQKMPFTRLGSWLEKVGAHQVVRHSIEETLNLMLRPGAAIPDFKPLLNAGMDADTARIFHTALLNSYGDVGKASGLVIDSMKAGKIDLFKAAAWIPDDTRTALRRFGVLDPVLEVIQGGNAETADDATQMIYEILNTLFDDAAEVSTDIAAVDNGHDIQLFAKDMSRALEDGLPRSVFNNVSHYSQANVRFMDAGKDTIRQWYRKTKNNPLWQKEMADGYPLAEWLMNPYFAGTRKKHETMLDITHGFVNELKKGVDAETVQKAWKELGIATPVPTDLDDIAGIKDEVWQHTFATVRNLYDKNRDQYAKVFLDTANELIAQGAVSDTRLFHHAKASLNLAERWENVLRQDQIEWVIRGAKNNTDAVVGVAKKYGMATIDDVGHAKRDSRLLALINKYNPPEGDKLYETLEEIPWKQAEKAFIERLEIKSGLRTEWRWIRKIRDAKAPTVKKLFNELKEKNYIKLVQDKIGENPILRVKVRTDKNSWVSLPVTGTPNDTPAVLNNALEAVIDWADSLKASNNTGANAYDEFVQILEKTFGKFADDIEDTEDIVTIGKKWVAIPDGFLVPKGAETKIVKGQRMARVKPGTKALQEAMEGLPMGALSDATHTPNQMVAAQLDGLRNVFDDLAKGVQQNFGTSKQLYKNDELVKLLSKGGAYYDDALQRIADAKLTAVKVAEEARKFTLLDYNQKRGFDTMLSYIYPYSFWYTRTYANWIKRIGTNYGTVAAFAKYKNAMEKIHSEMPEWWRHNINSNELLGLDAKNPLFFNLMATVNPLNGITGIDFNDETRRVNWWTRAIDDMGKFGPSVWTPINYAVATALLMKGEKEAANSWAGRLIPQTAHLKTLMTYAGADFRWQSGLNEFDPAIQLFNGGMDKWERRRVGRAYAAMMQNGEISAEDAFDSAYSQNDENWFRAAEVAQRQRGPGQLSSFLFGVGFKPRTNEDIAIDVMDQMLRYHYANRDNMSEEQFSQGFNDIRERFPFMDTVLLSRKNGLDRDSAYIYNILSRLPPSHADDFFASAGATKNMVSKFYENKGDLSLWNEADRARFMQAAVEIGAVAGLPDDVTRGEWNDAKKRYKEVTEEMKARFGEEIEAYISQYFDLSGDRQAQERFLRINPFVEQALDYRAFQTSMDPRLTPYYSSIDKIERYWNGVMWDNLYQKLGVSKEEMQEHWYNYNEAKVNGKGRKYWDNNPIMQDYMDLLDEYGEIKSKMMVNIAEKLPTPTLLVPREIEEGQSLSEAQQSILEYAENPQDESALSLYSTYSWDDWQNELPQYLQGLVLDHLAGADLSYAAENQLERIADNLDIDYPVMLEFMSRSFRDYIPTAP